MDFDFKSYNEAGRERQSYRPGTPEWNERIKREMNENKVLHGSISEDHLNYEMTNKTFGILKNASSEAKTAAFWNELRSGHSFTEALKRLYHLYGHERYKDE